MNINERVFYQVFTGSFNKDLRGIIEKLDYLKDLGIGGIWLTPIFESPSYHGYDVQDYYSVKKELGTMEDFEELVREAHKRDINIMLDMVFNHTSNQHEWFIKSSNGDEHYRNYYIWSLYNPHTGYTPMNNAPWAYSVESKPQAAYYYNSFCGTMPNLNHDNWRVREEIINVCKFWINKGVDAFRLDAVRWTFNEVEKGTAFWKWFREEVRKIKPDMYLVGEAWDSSHISRKYQEALGSCFQFELATHIIDKINWASLKYLGEYCSCNYNMNDSLFLSNHDQNRIMTELKNSKSKMKIAVTLLLSLCGTPYIYYSEELGMSGNKDFGDEGVRKDMPWEAAEIEEYVHSSLLNFYKKLINIRNSEVALRKGSFENLNVNNNSAMIYKRKYENEEVIVALNQAHEIEEIIEPGIYRVLFSNKGYSGTVTIKGYIELGPEEILILKRL